MQKKPLNILIISFDWRNIFENNFEELIQKLERDRLAPDFNKIFLFSWSTKTYYKEKGNIKTYHRKARLKHFRVLYDFLAIILVPYVIYKKKFRPDIVLVYEFPFAFSTILIKLLYKSKTVLLLGSLPADLVKTRKFGWLKAIYQKFTEKVSQSLVDIYLVITDATEKYLLNVGVKDNKIIKIFPNVIERDSKFIKESKMGKIRKKYKINENKKIILSVGRLEPEKGFIDLLDAFSSLKRDDLVLILVGEGVLKEQIREKIGELGFNNKVILAGQVNRKEIWNYYQDADVFILLSKSEGLGLVFWEAMYMRVPVIGSRVGGIVDTIGENEERGFFWDPRESPELLNKKIDACLDNIKELIEKKQKAGEFVKEKSLVQESLNDYFKK